MRARQLGAARKATQSVHRLQSGVSLQALRERRDIQQLGPTQSEIGLPDRRSLRPTRQISLAELLESHAADQGTLRGRRKPPAKGNQVEHSQPTQQGARVLPDVL